MTTATATTPSPLESYREGRDKILNVVLDAVSGLEGSVLDFMHDHEGKVRSAGFALSQALSETGRLERLVGEQALELDSARSHVCPVPAFADGLGLDPLDTTATAAPVIAPPAPEAAEAEESTGTDEAARTIAELRASLEAEQRTTAGLRSELEAEQRISAGLRTDLEGRAKRVTALEETATTAENNLRAAVEAHGDYVRDTQENFDQRLAAGARAAETGVRGEAIRIIEAIAADTPALAEAADLFTVAFPSEASATDSKEFTAPVPAPADIVTPVPAEDFFDNIPAGEPEAPAAPEPAESFDFVPAPEPEAAPAPLTQVYMAAPDLENDAILDPNFFDNPQPLEIPAGKAIQAPAPAGEPVGAPKPGYGLFGRKKENSTV